MQYPCLLQPLEPRTLLTGISFASAGTTNAPGGIGQYLLGWKNALIIEDVNRDGKQDVITIGGVALGNGAGGFTHRFSFSFGESLSLDAPAIAVGDFTGDAIPDVLLLGSQFRYLLRGIGDGTFIKQATSSFTSDKFLKVADLNRDGKPDILTSYSGSTIDVELGNGDGTFRGGSNLTAPKGSFLGDFQIQDLNNDGKLDVVSYNSNFNQRQSVIDMWLGNGDGTFKSIQQYSTGLFATDLAVGDVNGDSKVDIVTCNIDEATNSTSYSVHSGDGKGHFTRIYDGSGQPERLSG